MLAGNKAEMFKELYEEALHTEGRSSLVGMLHSVDGSDHWALFDKTES
jgi:hypothetical protein